MLTTRTRTFRGTKKLVYKAETFTFKNVVDILDKTTNNIDLMQS